MRVRKVERIIQIGKHGSCSIEDLLFFLPQYPLLRGCEFIFTIGWANSDTYIHENADNFIKGLHIIEMKYKEVSGHTFGFGSPSPTYKVISKLRNKNEQLADELEEWVAANGGNYYIQSKSPEDLF